MVRSCWAKRSAAHMTRPTAMSMVPITYGERKVDSIVSLKSNPAMPAGEWRRQAVMMRKLPEMEKRLKALEAKLGKS